jgi:hypothetical protein
MVQPILSDKILDQRLLEDGYVVIPFLTADEVSKLTDFYYQFHPRELNGMYATAHMPDLDLRVKMNNFIKDVFDRAISETCVNYNPLGGSFIAKGKGEQGALEPHQDWNIVDEEQYRSFNIWTPLVDLKENNGVIRVMHGSHLWLKSFRSANIPSAYSQVNELLWKKMRPLYMKAGEALIYDHRLVHASGPNRSDEIRLAAVYGIIPKDAQMFYYHKADEETIEVFESNPEFFLYGNIFEGPKGLSLVEKFAHDFPSMNEEKLYALTGWERDMEPFMLSETVAPARDSFFKKLGRIFGQE